MSEDAEVLDDLSPREGESPEKYFERMKPKVFEAMLRKALSGNEKCLIEVWKLAGTKIAARASVAMMNSNHKNNIAGVSFEGDEDLVSRLMSSVTKGNVSLEALQEVADG